MTENAGEAASLYERLGGAPGLLTYVDSFYEIMSADTATESIWAMHKRDLPDLKARLAAFLSGFVGGPVVYPQRYGAPMMRARHLAFPIGQQARDLWLSCAYRAIAASFSDRQAALEFARALTAFADHMRNVD